MKRKREKIKNVMIWKLSVKLSAWSLTVLTCNFCDHKNGALTKVKKDLWMKSEKSIKNVSQVTVSHLHDYSMHSHNIILIILLSIF